MIEPRPYLLNNQIQPYAWGTKGESAFIPHLLGIKAEPEVPYAELWMGTHPNAPSEIMLDDTLISLRELVAQFPHKILGEAVSTRFSGMLPFLFKVLSIAEALSIQAHPTKEQAQRLHARDPQHYPDDNHKPEVAIAIDSLTALAGFKPFRELGRTLQRYPELVDFVGPDLADGITDAPTASAQEQRVRLRALYAALTKRSVQQPTTLSTATGRLAKRLMTSDKLREEETLFLELREKYSGADVGLFTLFLLNLIHLEAGQGMFLDADIPHAYLKGNIVECMANSDNVVRAGLTPKFKDVETLVDILSYDMGPPCIIEAPLDVAETVYPTPTREFQVSRFSLKPGQTASEANHGPQVLLVARGSLIIRWGDDEAAFQRGQSILIPAALRQFDLEAESAATAFRVQVPLG
jgi:mannose-6-phosphate isomerase